MFLSQLQRSWPAALIATAAAAAQAQPAPGRPDPTDPSAAVPPLVYSSPWQGRRMAAPDIATGWLEANREVAAIGGWRAYAREAQASEPAASAASGALPARSMAPMPHHHAKPTPGARP